MYSDDASERTVYVRGLDDKVTKELLQELFIQVGVVSNISLKDPNSNPAAPNGSLPKGKFAFVEFEHEESVLFAVEMLDDIELFGKKITVAPRDKTRKSELYRELRSQFLQTRIRKQPADVPVREPKKQNFSKPTPTISGKNRSQSYANISTTSNPSVTPKNRNDIHTATPSSSATKNYYNNHNNQQPRFNASLNFSNSSGSFSTPKSGGSDSSSWRNYSRTGDGNTDRRNSSTPYTRSKNFHNNNASAPSYRQTHQNNKSDKFFNTMPSGRR